MIDDKTATNPQRKTSLRSYRNMKLKMLQRDFRISLTDEEIYHAHTLQTEAAIDQFVISVLNKHWC